MLIKKADDPTPDILALEALLIHPNITAATGKKISREIKAIRAGVSGEKAAAYEIDFHFKSLDNWAVIHDLRIEHKGRTAQIDHLLINRAMDIWVCESKYWANGIAVNDHGEFTSFYGKTAIGIPSPLEQNNKHITVLRSLFKDRAVTLPRRLGLTLIPSLYSIVLVSSNARITRPKIQVKGVDKIIKADQLQSYFVRNIDKETATFNVLKMIRSSTLESLAMELASLHKPHATNWNAKFGLPDERSSVPKGEKSGKKSKLICATCDVVVPFNTAKLCWFNKTKYGENVYCWDCQQAFDPTK